MYRLRAKRTTGTTAPDEMLFGELAYSDENQQLYIGRPTGPPATFISDLSPITDEIGSLATITLDQQVELAALTTTTSDQAIEIAALTTDVAALETSQATQDTAIGALITAVAAQDTAIDALDASSFSGAYADLSGKPSLFSGAYGDLTGKPTIPAGFTYDQQAEPSGPAAGATWRERSGGGLIVGAWEWSGSLWLSIQTYPLQNWQSNISGTTVVAFRRDMEIPRMDKLYFASVNWRIFLSSGLTASNNWKIYYQFNGASWAQPLLVNTVSDPLVGSKDVNLIVSGNPQDGGYQHIKAGTPGNISFYVEVLVKRIR